MLTATDQNPQKSYKSSAVAEMGDVATIDMGRKEGVLLCPFHTGARSSSNTMCPGPRYTFF